MSEAIKALASNIVARKKAGLEPYVLFLGAGASISSGCSTMLQIVEDVLQSHDSKQLEAWQKEVAEATLKDARFGDLLANDINEKKLSRFFETWSMLDTESRYAILRKHLWDDKTPSEGYVDLAHLVKGHYLGTILSTNLDNLMEKALSKVGLLSPENFIVVVNGKDSPEEVTDQTENQRASITLVKLHGSLESPRSYAFTLEELFDFERTIKPSLIRTINQSLLVVGHRMQDRDINILFEEEGKEIHFVNPVRPKLGSPMDSVLKVRGLGSVIDGAEGAFDNFFGQLRTHIESASTEVSTISSSVSIDGFLKAIGYENELKVPRSRYKNLDTLYVKPTEYDDILSKLENEHVLFIIGEPHMGKTYTALYLLWEYYKNGYDTIHIRHDELVSLLHRHEDNLKDLLLELFAPINQRSRIVHFDDPFGETSERRTDAFSNQLNTFLELANSYEHVRVVVTSRLNIFNEAIAESEIQTSLVDIEKTLRVHTSYSRAVLLDILRRYMHFYKPTWANDATIVSELNDKLPSMLPAPHNIEFFVSTSETLNSLESVLAHVEESKKMISALAGWMKHMSPHEQVFLMWVEICATASILFPGTIAAEIDIERAYKANLAYLFAEGLVPGIPTMPFSTAKDKFETILLERREDGVGLKFDFVHPSYHEAFWYAINQRFPIVQWWTLLNKFVGPILGNLDKRVDLVQLKMIERYGTINRDLDQLLLLSAESNDAHEQLIALEHMLRRPEQFTNLPEFSRCLQSVVSAEDDSVRAGFLDVYENYFNQLSLVVLRAGPALLFDHESDIRIKAQKLFLTLGAPLPESVQQEETLKTWDVLSKLRSADRLDHDWVMHLFYGNSELLAANFANLTPAEIVQLTKTKVPRYPDVMLRFAENVWEKLSSEQREALNVTQFLETDDTNLRDSAQSFAFRHLKDLAHLSDRYTFISGLVKLHEAFNIPKEQSIVPALQSISTDKWPLPFPSLREIACVSTQELGQTITTRILENYDELPVEYRDTYLETLFKPESIKPLVDYVGKQRYGLDKVSDNVLMKLLSARGYVQYEILPALLCRFDTLSAETRQLIMKLVDNPSDWWVGASIGQITWQRLTGRLSKDVQAFPRRIIDLHNKRITGALLAEMTQSYLDDNLGLTEQYESMLLTLSSDSEVVRHAEEWMDHQLKVFNFKNENYWSDMKQRLRSLSEN
jgi:hypothetical protein